MAAPWTRQSDSVVSGAGAGEGVGVGVLAGQGVDATCGVMQDDPLEARSAGAAHVEGLPAGSTPWANAHHATRRSSPICVGLLGVSTARVIP